MDDSFQKFKLAMVGDSGVGKTSLLNVIMNPDFNDFETVALTINQKCFTINYNNSDITFSIWDTCGHERFRSLTPIVFKGCDGVILVFDITTKRTFSCLHEYIQLINTHCPHSCKLFLVGNKLDLQAERAVSYFEAMSYKNDINANTYIETSAWTHQNIDNLMQSIASAFQESQKIEPKAVTVESSQQSSNSSCFC